MVNASSVKIARRRIIKINICFFMAIVLFLSNNCAFAQAAAASRIVSERTVSPWFERMVVGVGASKTTYSETISSNFIFTDYSLALSLEQYIRGIFTGELSLYAAQWQFSNKKLFAEKIYPLHIMSNVQAVPNLTQVFSDMWPAFFRPYAYGGLGYIFYSSFTEQAKKQLTFLSPEMTFAYGLGAKFIVSNNVALKLSFDSGMGMQSSTFSAQSIVFEVQYGDMSLP